MTFVAPIVEGHGELDAVPILLRRIAAEEAGKHLQINAPYRVSASSFLKFEREFQKAIQLSAGKAIDNDGFVLILLDCEDDCPAQLGPKILSAAQNERSDAPFVVVLAFREFETWFLYGASSLAGLHGLPDHLTSPEEPETFRDAKGWLGNQMPRGYKETVHQAPLIAKLDFGQAKRSSSFDRLVQKVVTLIQS